MITRINRDEERKRRNAKVVEMEQPKLVGHDDSVIAHEEIICNILVQNNLEGAKTLRSTVRTTTNGNYVGILMLDTTYRTW